MSKYRISYTQGDEVRFISHLDFLRCITRTFRRAHLPVKYSEGFNPHMVMTIGLPLSVGTSSECDCLDAELTEEIDTAAFVDKLNAVTPRGIHINGIKKAEGLRPLFEIDSALYEASFGTDKVIDIGTFIDAQEVMIEKKSKRKINEVNIKDFIRDMKILSSDGEHHALAMRINAGNTSNLKPELVLGAIAKLCNCNTTDVKICRKEIYFDDMTKVF